MKTKEEPARCGTRRVSAAPGRFGRFSVAGAVYLYYRGGVPPQEPIKIGHCPRSRGLSLTLRAVLAQGVEGTAWRQSGGVARPSSRRRSQPITSQS
jgi:hypothetical protein